ncbi:hypothetical protein Tco_1238247, partial [Tanacetum coccineum]
MSQLANDDFTQHLSDDEASYHEDASENGTEVSTDFSQQFEAFTISSSKG